MQTFENKFIPLTAVSGTVLQGGDVILPGDTCISFTTYSVYDGPDALIASKLGRSLGVGVCSAY